MRPSDASGVTTELRLPDDLVERIGAELATGVAEPPKGDCELNGFCGKQSVCGNSEFSHKQVWIVSSNAWGDRSIMSMDCWMRFSVDLGYWEPSETKTDLLELVRLAAA